jgi:hypothetical protein
MRLILLALIVVVVAVFVYVRVERSGGPAPEKVKEDLKTLGRDLKGVATQAATEIEPAVRAATQKGRELLHEGAQKVSEWTETRPGTGR